MFCYQSALLWCWALTRGCAATKYASLSLSLGARLMLASHFRKLCCRDSAGRKAGAAGLVGHSVRVAPRLLSSPPLSRDDSGQEEYEVRTPARRALSCPTHYSTI